LRAAEWCTVRLPPPPPLLLLLLLLKVTSQRLAIAAGQ
jgi:hypothetical protein